MIQFLYIAIIFMVQNNDTFYCKWGKPVKISGVMGCTTLMQIRTPLPVDGKRLEFRRRENPGLSAYFIRKKDGIGPIKPFKNLVNLYAVDLFLCPKDFQNPKTLLFHLKTIHGWKAVQCKLSTRNSDSMDNKTINTNTNTRPTPVSQDKDNVHSISNNNKQQTIPQITKKQSNQPVTQEIDFPSIITPRDDPFARTLGWGALILSIFSLILSVIALIRIGKNRHEEAKE